MSTETKPAEKRPAPPVDPVISTAPQLTSRFGIKYGIDQARILDSLRATAFRQPGNNAQPVTTEQMVALMVVAEQYNLNPWTKEIYAFPTKEGGIMPIVGIDGWIRIINERPELNGFDFEYGDVLPAPKDEQDRTVGQPGHEWIECRIYRRDREHPIVVREYLAECRRSTGPWNDMPRRMLRHKALIQCARYAFGFAGIYDEDEAERVIQREAITVNNTTQSLPNGRVQHKKPGTLGMQAVTPASCFTASREKILELTPAQDETEVPPARETVVNGEVLTAEEDIRRSELITHIEEELEREDISRTVLTVIGESLRRNRQLLGEAEATRLTSLWLKRTGAASDPAFATQPAPPKGGSVTVPPKNERLF